MSKSKRVAFTFDERSYAALEEMTREGKYTSMADALRESLQVARAIQEQAQRGFSEVILRNPETGAERVVLIPHLKHFVLR